MDENKIIQEVLLKLDNWVLEDVDNNVDVGESISFEYNDLDYNKKITTNEILHFYKVANDYALSYTQQKDLTKIPIIDTALILWTAGLIWRKYDIRPNDQIDESYSIGYGDSLIIQAKEMLKPYKNYNFNIF